MSSSRSALLAELREHRANLDLLDSVAARESRAFNRSEQASYDASLGRIAAIDAEAELGRAGDVVASVNRNIGIGGGREMGDAEVGRTSLERTVGEFAHEQGRVQLTLIGNRRWADDAEMGRVVAHGISGDGTAPVTIEGDLIKFVDANRYAVNASRRLPMPANHAPTFKRPRVTQRTTVGQQVTEGDVLSSQRLQLTGDTLTKLTRGGVLSLSEQEIDWTDPAMLGQAVVDLAQSYAIDTDTVLTAAIEAAVTEGTETVLSLTATLAQFVAGVASSANAVYTSAKRLPDTLFVAPDRWAYIASLVDTTGRPAFPIAGAGPLNAAGLNAGGVATFSGMNVLGLNVVVDPNFSANVMIVAASSLVEFYEQDKGLLSVNVPSTLEIQYAYRGYVAANVYAQALNGIEAA